MTRIAMETCRADKRKNSRERTGNRKAEYRNAKEGHGAEEMR